MKTEDGRELLDIIEESITKLEEIASIKWQNDRFNITRTKFKNALELAVTGDKPLWEELGYKRGTAFSNAINKVITNIQNRPKRIQWIGYILDLVGYKRCSSCHSVDLKSNYANNKSKKSGKADECRNCSHNNNKIYRENNKEKLAEKNKVYRENNKEKLAEKNKVYRENNKEKISKQRKEYRKDNKERIAEQRRNRKIETYNHLVKIRLVIPFCSICGYKENRACLDTHHVDSTLQRPDYSYNKDGSKKSPSSYIFNCGKELAEERYINEAYNLITVCKNCHKKEENNAKIDQQKGTRLAVEELGHIYKCEKCEETHYLHLHHNNQLEREYGFVDFHNQSKERILNDGLLEKELKKDVSILCPNHHYEYHHPNWAIINGEIQ